MNIFYYIALFLFLLIPEVAVIDRIIESPSYKEYQFQLLEEEKEIETITALAKSVSQKNGGPSGGYVFEQKPFTSHALSFCINNTERIQISWITFLKNPRYIQFCNLKLDC
jgi:hypothetical protein